MMANMASSNPHPADSHDLIRVQGARVNNLKDVSVEIPKRRLTVFTGVSGSGKSSLVFGTIAAESQRLINETYSAFVQGFMPAMARPEVDVLEGLTTAIIVDQERMGANSRSTVGTVTDANAMLRVLFSRLAKPHIGPSTAYSFNVPTRKASGAMTVDKGKGQRIVVRDVVYQGGMCPRCEGMGSVNDIDLSQLFDESKSLSEGALRGSRLHGRRLARAILRGRRHRSGQADPQVHEEGASRLPLQGAKQAEGSEHEPHLRGPDPAHPEVVSVQRPRCDAAAHPRVRGARGHVHDLSRMQGHSAQRGRPLFQDQGDQHRRRLCDADHRSGEMGARPERAVGRAVGGEAAADARLVRGNWSGLPQPRPAIRHVVRR